MIRILLVLAVFCNSLHSDLCRMQSESPLNGFVMPMFDESGQKIWQCIGDKVHYMNNNNAEIEKMKIEWFNPSKKSNIEMTIRSDNATLSLSTHIAEGKSLITVNNIGYTILGEDWTWEGKQKNKNFSKLLLKKNAHVMFFD